MSKTSIPKVKVSMKDDDFGSETIEYFEQTGNWRNIIFLPHNYFWKLLIVFTIVANCLLVIYSMYFIEELGQGWLSTAYYIFEIFYFANVILMLMHRYMVYQKTQVYFPKPMALLMIDIVTLLPYYETYYLLKSKSEISTEHLPNDYWRIKVLGRLVTVIHFFHSVGNEPGLNHLALLTLQQLVIYVLYTMVVSAIWFGLKKDDRLSWAACLKYHQFDNSSRVSWFIVSYTTIGNCLGHNWAGTIHGETTIEALVLSSTMMFGYLLHIMIYFGHMITAYIKKIGDQFEFSYRLRVIMRLLGEWDVKTNVKNSIIDSYNMLWEKRSGHRRLPKLFFELPQTLQKQCSLDTFWFSIKHSQLLSGIDDSFVKHMALYMECQYYMPGEYLYHLHELKTKFVYIVSGVVQILSQEDQESAVMSFSGGTVLGEICCLVCSYSNVNIRCASYCEVQILDMRYMNRLFLKYPHIKKLLHGKLKQRLALATKMQHLELLKLKRKEEKRTSIKWIKTQWRTISYITRTSKKGIEDKQKYIVPHHISKFLSLYVLSDEVELKVAAICLNSKCPFVVEPSSTFRQACDYVILVSAVIQSLMIPYIAIFKRELTIEERGFLYMMDVVYLIGLYIELSTAVKISGRLISKIQDIIIYKIKQTNTLIDILSTVPFELLGFLTTTDPHTEILMHMNRVLKIYRLFRLIVMAEFNVWRGYIEIRLIKFSFLFIFFLYCLSCLHYVQTCFKKCERIGWYHYNKYLFTVLRDNQTIDLPPFIASFDLVTSKMLNLNWNNSYAYSIKDMTIEHLLVLLGYFLLSFCFAQLGACAVLQLKANSEYQLYLKGLKHFVIRKSIPSSMRSFMYTMIQCQWQYNDRHEITGPNGILADLPSHLIEKAFIHRIVQCLKLNPLFIYSKESTLITIAKIARVGILPPNTIIMRENTICTELNFILRGYCKAESEIPTDKYHGTYSIMTTGDCFPVMEMLMNINTFLKVTAVTFVEMITIPHNELAVHLKSSVGFYENLEAVVQKHLKDNEIVLTRQKGKLPKMVAKIKAQPVGDYFVYETNEDMGLKKDRLMYERTFGSLGKWKFIRHLMLKRTFVPTQKFYISWEIFRCVIAFIHVTYVVFFMKFTMILKMHRPLERVFICIGLIDFYIRMHTAYYNKDGILVTHPLYTAKNYIRNSFLLDIITILPFGELKINYMFGRRYRKHALLFSANATRPLMFYRIFNGITYLEQSSKEGRAILFHIIKYVLLVFVLLSVLALFLLGLACPGENAETAIICPNNSWIQNHELLKDTVKKYTNTVVAYYVVISTFASCLVSLYTFTSKEQVIMMISMASILFAVRWFVLAKITSSRIGGNTMLVHYQHKMKVLLKFLQQNYINKNLMTELVAHYEHIWKKTKGYTSTSVLHSFHPVLMADFTYHLYARTLRQCEIFKGVDTSVIRYISTEFEELHFKKDAHIIRCNDVADTIYIVYKGMIQISVANDHLCILTPGGVFGCLKLFGITRQTICAKAIVHADLLAIKCSKFHKVVANFTDIKRKLRRAMFVNTEYILSTDVSAGTELETLEETKKDGAFGWKWEHLLINMDGFAFRSYNYIVNVHVATLSSILIAGMIAKIGEFDIAIYYYYMYIFDVIFVIKIYIGFNLSYVDPESGVQVKDFKTIQRRYLKAGDGLWFDLVTCLPLELIAIGIGASKNWYRLCWLNRTFRFVFLMRYYNNCKNTLIVSKILRWNYLMYTLLLLLSLMILVWWRVACPDETCLYNNQINHEKISFISSNVTIDGFRIASQYVINIFSGTGYRKSFPNTRLQLVAAIAMVCVAQFTQLSLTIGFASMLLLDKLVMSKYERDANHVLQYVKAISLSLMLRTQIWKYYVMLWTRAHGSWVPELLKDSPTYLKEDVLAELYGKHINNHFLFKKTHVDFIRQLVAHLEPCVFMPGMYVTEKGDIDGCMYFLEDGEIIVYDKHGNNEIEQLVLTAGKTFGEVQCLYDTPHDRSYRARFVCTVLILNRKNWWCLLDWFPASKEYIFEQAARHFRKPYLVA